VKLFKKLTKGLQEDCFLQIFRVEGGGKDTRKGGRKRDGHSCQEIITHGGKTSINLNPPDLIFESTSKRGR
jgi:hypothetical protein